MRGTRTNRKELRGTRTNRKELRGTRTNRKELRGTRTNRKELRGRKTWIREEDVQERRNRWDISKSMVIKEKRRKGRWRKECHCGRKGKRGRPGEF